MSADWRHKLSWQLQDRATSLPTERKVTCYRCDGRRCRSPEGRSLRRAFFFVLHARYRRRAMAVDQHAAAQSN